MQGTDRSGCGIDSSDTRILDAAARQTHGPSDVSCEYESGRRQVREPLLAGEIAKEFL
jgi:hypothetical protein